jgi:hypothetical protein
MKVLCLFASSLNLIYRRKTEKLSKTLVRLLTTDKERLLIKKREKE